MDKKEKLFLITLTSISLILLLFTSVSSAALASTVQNTQLTINEIQITTNGSSQNIPDIYEDRIVWADYRNGNLDIYMYDLSNFTEAQITTDESNQYYPEIYGENIYFPILAIVAVNKRYDIPDFLLILANTKG
ncbi:hypothetical protein FXV91_04405 [Methanosarcina sp. DH2]|uniref:hypothetical protein n=1 Tax=Methanosarcina sp. DH2 TaxID=2605639 RepID=UPI001E2C247A|nr:hypothetical protein [Methanosarcina sp. DH2]MCC4769463.1 hypothetical protein [Methanosarcina sp. DH2]